MGKTDAFQWPDPAPTRTIVDHERSDDILIAFHQSHYSNFKAHYCEQVFRHWRPEFPKLVSYNRFVQFIVRLLSRWQCTWENAAWASVQASRSSIPPRWRCVTMVVSTTTRCLRAWPGVGLPLPVGPLASNSTWCAMIRMNCSLFTCHLVIWMTANQSHVFYSSISLERCMAIRVMSRSPCSNT